MWHDVHPGYLGAYINDGFASDLILRVARDLALAMPVVFANYTLAQLWAYKYDRMLNGISVHADVAAVK